MPAERPRPQFASRFGVIMAFMGVAVGLGNVWRFPYMASAFGGGAFLLLYMILLCAFGIPTLMAELTLGRLSQRGPMGAFSAIGMPGGRAIAWILLITAFMALSYYTVVVGWVLRYAVISVTGEIMHVAPETFFQDVVDGFVGQLLMTAVVLGLAWVVLAQGIRNGIERISKIGMPVLFVLLLILLGRSLTLPGAGEGIRFYLMPDFSQITSGVLTASLGQVFFSLSLGGTFMVTYASYLSHDINLKQSAITVGVGETLVAILAGFVIVPAAVALGLELNSGPPLTFVTAPSIFAAIPTGALFATLFFALLFFAAFLSVVAAFEVLVTAFVDKFGWPRRRAIATFIVASLLAGIPAMLSVNYILNSDLLWGSIMQPIGSVFALIGLAWVVGQGKALEAVNRGNNGIAVGRVWIFWIKYVVPAGIVIILTIGVVDLFATFV